MNEKELSEKVRLLQKAVTGAEPPSTIVTMLDGLKKADSPSEQTLRVCIVYFYFASADFVVARFQPPYIFWQP